MAKKKDEPPAPPAEAVPTIPFDDLMASLATASAKLQGKEGDEVRKHVDHVKQHVEALVQKVQLDEEDAMARKAAAAEVEKLIEAVAKTGTAAGKAIETQRGPLKQTFQGVELAKLSAGLRLFADWLANPTNENQAQVRQLIEQLQQTMGPVIGWDQEREDEERRAAIKKDVQASLDEIFRGKKKPE